MSTIVLRKIVVDKDGGYKIRLPNNQFIGESRTGTIFGKDQDLTGIVNKNYIAIINDKVNPIETINKYVPPVPETLETKKIKKANEFLSKRDDKVMFAGQEFNIPTLAIFNSSVPLSDEEIVARLPILTNTDYKIDTLKKVKDLNIAYLDHRILNHNNAVKCNKAKTLEELEDIK